MSMNGIYVVPCRGWRNEERIRGTAPSEWGRDECDEEILGAEVERSPDSSGGEVSTILLYQGCFKRMIWKPKVESWNFIDKWKWKNLIKSNVNILSQAM